MVNKTVSMVGFNCNAMLSYVALVDKLENREFRKDRSFCSERTLTEIGLSIKNESTTFFYLIPNVTYYLLPRPERQLRPSKVYFHIEFKIVNIR